MKYAMREAARKATKANLSGKRPKVGQVKA